MGIVTPPPQPAHLHPSPPKPYSRALAGPDSSMSQGYNQGIFSFPDGFDRSASQEQQQHIAQQSRRDKLRVQGFDPVGHHLVPIEEEGEEPSGIYEPPGAANMLSDLFNFPTAGPSATELLANQIPGGYRFAQRPISVAGFSGDWYGSNRQGGVVLSSSGLSSIGDAAVKHHHDSSGHAMPGLNADSAAAMQLFLMNPPAGAASHPAPPRSPSPPQAPPPHPTLHHHQAFQQAASFGDTSFGGGVVEGQGLSLSLSSSLRQFEVGKAEDPRVRDALLYFNARQQHHVAQGQHGQHGEGHGQLHMGYGAAGVVNVLRTSKYARPAQELLEEFCSVGRGQHKGSRIGRHHRGGSSNPNPNPGGHAGGGASSAAAGSSSSSKDPPPLSPADRFEHQRKKAKLLSMLDEARTKHLHTFSLSLSLFW